MARILAKWDAGIIATFNVEICGGSESCEQSCFTLRRMYIKTRAFSLDDYREAILSNFGYLTAMESGSYSLFEQKKE